MREVTVVGAGIAGMSAALRLAERGFAVTLIEQDDHVGGNLGAYKNPQTGDYSEHCFHMYLNWYGNFWKIARELGVIDRFVPSPNFRYYRRGEYPQSTLLSNVGDPSTMLANLASGVVAPADMFIYAYSLLDLVAESFERDRFLDMISVNGFLASRPYATDAAARQHNRILAKAFAASTFRTSAASYRRFVEFSMRQPTPMTWVLGGNVHEHFNAFLEHRLIELGCKIRKLTRIDHLVLGADGAVQSLQFSKLDRSPLEAPAPARVTGQGSLPVNGALVLAVPPGGLMRLLDDKLYLACPELAGAAHLRTEPMTSIDLYFKHKVPDLPRDHVILIDSPHDVTFIDNSQWWPDEPTTVLNVAASQSNHLSALSLETAFNVVVDELREYVPFDWEDVDLQRCRTQYNTRSQLFVNEVGSWQHRPETHTRIDNLFLAGDYCRSFVDVVTIEGAVVTGLNAAEAVRRRSGQGEPIDIVRPPVYPTAEIQAMKALLTPHVYSAKVLSSMSGWPDGDGGVFAAALEQVQEFWQPGDRHPQV